MKIAKGLRNHWCIQMRLVQTPYLLPQICAGKCGGGVHIVRTTMLALSTNYMWLQVLILKIIHMLHKVLQEELQHSSLHLLVVI